MWKTVLTGVLITIASGLNAQNQLDDQGRRTGRWEVEYPNGRTRYSGIFKEGKPVGEMIHYYEDGGVRARMHFDSTGSRSYTRLYYESGKKAAEGWFVDEAKDSVWTYFSEYDGLIRFREPYREGSLHGTLERYYQHGSVSEAVEWDMDQKQGSWKQYYPDGSLRLHGTYVDDQLTGPYRVFYPDSTLKIEGQYHRNLSEGSWNYYDESGEQIYTIQYENGRALNQERYLQLMNDSIMKQDQMAEPEDGSRPNF